MHAIICLFSFACLSSITAGQNTTDLSSAEIIEIISQNVSASTSSSDATASAQSSESQSTPISSSSASSSESESTQTSGSSSSTAPSSVDSTSTSGSISISTSSFASSSLSSVIAGESSSTSSSSASESTNATGDPAEITLSANVTSDSNSTNSTDASSTVASTTAQAAPQPQANLPGLPKLSTGDAALSPFIAKGTYVKTTAVEKACKQNQDCYNLREPDEWCPLPTVAKYGDKGCFCDHIRNVCTIQRQSEKGDEYSDCGEKANSGCYGFKPVVEYQLDQWDGDYMTRMCYYSKRNAT